MKKVGNYFIPDGLALIGLGFACCYARNERGDVYLIRIVHGVQHIRRLDFTIEEFRKGVLRHYEI